MLSEEAYGDFLNAEPGLFLPVTEAGGEYSTWRDNEGASEISGAGGYTPLGSIDRRAFRIYRRHLRQDRIDHRTEPDRADAQQITVNGQSPAEAAAWGQTAMEEAVAE